MSRVVNAMEDALIRRYPKSRYLVASLLDKGCAYLYQFFPTFVFDFITLKGYDKLKADATASCKYNKM